MVRTLTNSGSTATATAAGGALSLVNAGGTTADLGVDGAGTAYFRSATGPLQLRGPGGDLSMTADGNVTLTGGVLNVPALSSAELAVTSVLGVTGTFVANATCAVNKLRLGLPYAVPYVSTVTRDNVMVLGNTNAVVAAPNAVAFASTNGYTCDVSAVIGCQDGTFAAKGWLCTLGGDSGTGNLATYQGNGAYLGYSTSYGGTTLVNRRNANAAAGGWRFVAQGPTGAVENGGNAALVVDQAGNLVAAGVAVSANVAAAGLTAAAATLTGNLVAAGVTASANVAAAGLTATNAALTGNLACANSTATAVATGAMVRVGTVNSHFWLLNGAADNATLNNANTNAILASWNGLGFANYSANSAVPPVNAVVNCREGSWTGKSFLCSQGGGNATGVLGTYQGNGGYFSYAVNAFGGSTVFTNRRNGASGGTWRFVGQDSTGNAELASVGFAAAAATLDHAGNAAFAGTLTAGNAALTSPAGRLTFAANATTGNTGVLFTDGGYVGPLAERRAGATNRLGLGVYGTADARVYSATTSTAARVLLGFATSDTTFYDVLTVAREGSSTTTGNVGINTGAPAYPLHVVGNAYVVGSLTASGDVTAFSDARLKSNLVALGDSVARVARLTGYAYDRVDMPGRRFVGLLAQDVQAVLPEAVHTMSGTMGVSYAGVAGLLVEAVKALDRRVAALENGLPGGVPGP